MKSFSESDIEAALDWAEENDVSEDQLDRFSVAFSYLFNDEELNMSEQEADYVMFLWAVLIKLHNKTPINNETLAQDIEANETLIWEALERGETERRKISDTLEEHAAQKELFYYLEDGLSHDPSDGDNPLSTKELAQIVLIKFISLSNTLS